MITRLIVFAFIVCPALLAAQEQGKGYMVTDPNGKGVYLIPECIVEKTVSTTMSLPNQPSVAAPGAGSFLVQVGAFARPENAERMERLLRQEGFTVRTWTALFRHRTLPVKVVAIVSFATRDAADAVRQKVDAAYGVVSLVASFESANLAFR